MESFGIALDARGAKVNNSTDVHHCDYKNIYDVNGTDVLALCRPCHEIIEHAKRVGLLKSKHHPKEAIHVTKNKISGHTSKNHVLSKKLVHWISIRNIVTQRLVCGVLKILPPKDWHDLEGVKVRQSQFFKIISLCKGKGLGPKPTMKPRPKIRIRCHY